MANLQLLVIGSEEWKERRLAYLEKERKKLLAKSFLAMIQEATLTVDIARIKLLLMILDKE